jgi:large subunit ribosomal protein L30e
MVEVDINKALNMTIRTGKVLLGAKLALDAARSGKTKLIILSSNCPKMIRQDMEYYTRLSAIPLYTFKGSGMDLGATCGKPFSVAALAIKEIGDSDIMKTVEDPNAK